MTIPDPMTPADCDLRGLEYMPLLGQRLFGSEFDAMASDCGSAWKRNPGSGVIGVEKGPLIPVV